MISSKALVQYFGAGTLPVTEVVSRLPPDAMVSVETFKDSKD